MATTEMVRSTVKGASGVNLVIGIWLVLAPFVLAYSDVTAALWNDIVVGLAVIVLAGMRVSRPLSRVGASWTNLVLGVWLIAAPFVLMYSETAAAMWNDIVAGVLIAMLAAWSAVSSRNVEQGSSR